MNASPIVRSASLGGRPRTRRYARRNRAEIIAVSFCQQAPRCRSRYLDHERVVHHKEGLGARPCSRFGSRSPCWDRRSRTPRRFRAVRYGKRADRRFAFARRQRIHSPPPGLAETSGLASRAEARRRQRASRRAGIRRQDAGGLRQNKRFSGSAASDASVGVGREPVSPR